MQRALRQAQRAFDRDEVPIGAVVVDQKGTVIAQAYNLVETKNTQAAHAEVQALIKAAKKVGDWRLTGCWLYVTLEPCTMCMGLIQLSRLAGVVYGPASPLFGFQLDNAQGLPLYKKDAVQIIQGVCASESVGLLKQFFKKQRKKRE